MGMTEPGGGTDLQNMKTRAERRGDSYVVHGLKPSSPTAPSATCWFSRPVGPVGTREGRLTVSCSDQNGLVFASGKRLKKIGLHGSDTCELYFDGCSIPAHSLLGEAEGNGFYQMMQELTYERALAGVKQCGRSSNTPPDHPDYVRERKAFVKH